ncbi:ABC transporter ATP-binding protein [Pseudophaeobacter arcticus]|jgi:iron complex transport system ATP-binding protein|uniref:ABC transporter ATP-binding protein n=1 Tax=Pseudophaeobacter arcticus TaxID=385492 RepID=UPI0004072A1B|nr:ABC transporter ATP-binding protein [Pseudophaeobacter arcticus]
MTGSPPLSRPFLCVRDLEYFALNGDLLVSGVSFDLQQGSILAIAGPNGAGKSTLLNLLSGCEPLALGEVFIGGASLRQMKAQDRAGHIALVSQQSSPDGRLRLQDYIALGQLPIAARRSAHQNSQAIEAILDLTGLTKMAHKPMAQLSGGERQRAHIARALAQEPKLLFLDEPTNHLDPDAKGRILSLVASLGITVVMVVHDLVMIPEFATHAALMKSTRLVAFGPAAEVLTPENVQATFGVSYLCFPHEGRMIPALDIRKTDFQNLKENSQ